MDIKLILAEKTVEDCKLIMQWRNNPETLEMFYDQRPKEFSSFWPEYQEKYFNISDLPPYFALNGTDKIAFLRSARYLELNLAGEIFDIDINVAPKSRGSGLGSKIIRLFADKIINSGATVVIAEVKTQNIASLKAFERAGFKNYDQMTKQKYGQSFDIKRLIFES